MNPVAAQEILDIIMLDDYVARKQALDIWTRRWISTMQVEGRVQDRFVDQRVWAGMRANLLREAFNGLVKDEVHALNWGHLLAEDGTPDQLTLACQMHVILQVPREINAGADAAKAMMDMARGGK